MNGESTSAALFRVEAERDKVLADGDRISTRLLDTTLELSSTLAELVSAQTELKLLREELAMANAWPAWSVARAGGMTCTACRQPIRRGEAYSRAVVADTTAHVHCPDREAS